MEHSSIFTTFFPLLFHGGQSFLIPGLGLLLASIFGIAGIVRFRRGEGLNFLSFAGVLILIFIGLIGGFFFVVAAIEDLHYRSLI